MINFKNSPSRLIREIAHLDDKYKEPRDWKEKLWTAIDASEAPSIEAKRLRQAELRRRKIISRVVMALVVGIVATSIVVWSLM